MPKGGEEVDVGRLEKWGIADLRSEDGRRESRREFFSSVIVTVFARNCAGGRGGTAGQFLAKAPLSPRFPKALTVICRRWASVSVRETPSRTQRAPSGWPWGDRTMAPA